MTKEPTIPQILTPIMLGCIASLGCAWILDWDKGHILASAPIGCAIVSVMWGTMVTALVAQFTFLKK